MIWTPTDMHALCPLSCTRGLQAGLKETVTKSKKQRAEKKNRDKKVRGTGRRLALKKAKRAGVFSCHPLPLSSPSTYSSAPHPRTQRPNSPGQLVSRPRSPHYSEGISVFLRCRWRCSGLRKKYVKTLQFSDGCRGLRRARERGSEGTGRGGRRSGGLQEQIVFSYEKHNETIKPEGVNATSHITLHDKRD